MSRLSPSRYRGYAALHDVLPRRDGKLPDPAGPLTSSLPSTEIEDAIMAITRVRTVAADNNDNDSSGSAGVDAMCDGDDDV